MVRLANTADHKNWSHHILLWIIVILLFSLTFLDNTESQFTSDYIIEVVEVEVDEDIKVLLVQ